MQEKTKSLIVSILIPIAVGALAGLITRSGMADYQGLQKPFLNPPMIVFPIVWNILYILMGISSWLVSQSHSPAKSGALFIYGVQLAFNFLWTILFFGLELRLLAFIWLLLLIILIVWMIVKFYRVKPLAGVLQIPYLLWSSFAAYLNIMVYLLNR